MAVVEMRLLHTSFAIMGKISVEGWMPACLYMHIPICFPLVVGK